MGNEPQRKEPRHDLIPYITNRLTDPRRRTLADLLGWASPAASATVRFHEDKDSYYAELDLPGVRKEDLQLNTEGFELTLAAERETGFGESKRKVRYTRGLTLPEDVDVDKIRAEFKDGVLNLVFPKREESKPKQLKIKVD